MCIILVVTIVVREIINKFNVASMKNYSAIHAIDLGISQNFAISSHEKPKQDTRLSAMKIKPMLIQGLL